MPDECRLARVGCGADSPCNSPDRVSYASSSARISPHNSRHSAQIAAGPADVSPGPVGMAAIPVT
ncbi:MAG: hypothetical protein ACRDPD_33160 [Streptosporangiaceae bacterium]